MNGLRKIVKFILYVAFYKLTLAESGDVYYVGAFTDDITDCDGFENNVFKCNDLNIGFVEGGEDGEGGLGLSGQLELIEPVNKDYIINLEVWKIMDVVKELMYTVSGDLCSTLQKDDTPWWPLMKSLNTTECPVVEKVYPVENMMLSLAFAKNVLRHELCGSYIIQLTITNDLEQQLSCHMVPAEIVEKTRQ